jgi:hypothetical protein
LLARYGDAVTRLTFYTPYQTAPERWTPVLDAIKAG